MCIVCLFCQGRIINGYSSSLISEIKYCFPIKVDIHCLILERCFLFYQLPLPRPLPFLFHPSMWPLVMNHLNFHVKVRIRFPMVSPKSLLLHSFSWGHRTLSYLCSWDEASLFRIREGIHCAGCHRLYHCCNTPVRVSVACYLLQKNISLKMKEQDISLLPKKMNK